jgi:hypothetical protein
VQIALIHHPDTEVIAKGSYWGGPEYEFVIGSDDQVYFRVVDGKEEVWAGPDAESFRRIVATWSQFRDEVTHISTKGEKFQRFTILKRELASLGALPNDKPIDPEPLWSLLISEAENELSN